MSLPWHSLVFDSFQLRLNHHAKHFPLVLPSFSHHINHNTNCAFHDSWNPILKTNRTSNRVISIHCTSKALPDPDTAVCGSSGHGDELFTQIFRDYRNVSVSHKHVWMGLNNMPVLIRCLCRITSAASRLMPASPDTTDIFQKSSKTWSWQIGASAPRWSQSCVCREIKPGIKPGLVENFNVVQQEYLENIISNMPLVFQCHVTWSRRLGADGLEQTA